MSSLSVTIGIELSPISLREKMISALGGFVSMLVLLGITYRALGSLGAAAVVGSMGASAVLLFGVPHGQLSQPWPVIAEHGFAALIGVACHICVPCDRLAGSLAVGLSIGLMHQLKCIHPPGGATALTAVLGGVRVHEMGFQFVFFPVLANAMAMVAIAVLFNWWFPWRRYPAAWSKPRTPVKRHPEGEEASHEDIVKALRGLDSFVDVTEDDLITLSRGVARERQARLLRTARRIGP